MKRSYQETKHSYRENNTHHEMKHSSETESQTRFKQRLSSPEILKVRRRIRGNNAHQQNACYPLN